MIEAITILIVVGGFVAERYLTLRHLKELEIMLKVQNPHEARQLIKSLNKKEQPPAELEMSLQEAVAQVGAMEGPEGIKKMFTGEAD